MLMVKMTATATAKAELLAMLTVVNRGTSTKIAIETETLADNVTVLSTATTTTMIIHMAAGLPVTRAKTTLRKTVTMRENIRAKQQRC